jgi:hypothetical protein
MGGTVVRPKKRVELKEKKGNSIIMMDLAEFTWGRYPGGSTGSCTRAPVFTVGRFISATSPNRSTPSRGSTCASGAAADFPRLSC